MLVDRREQHVPEREGGNVGFPEYKCDKGHRWYKGEGVRRNINGINPILFESHLYNRKRREIVVRDGVPDPAYTMDRWGKRTIHGIYNRAHPQGRKVNSESARARHGASYFRAFVPWPLLLSGHYILLLIIVWIAVLQWNRWHSIKKIRAV